MKIFFSSKKKTPNQKLLNASSIADNFFATHFFYREIKSSLNLRLWCFATTLSIVNWWENMLKFELLKVLNFLFVNLTSLSVQELFVNEICSDNLQKHFVKDRYASLRWDPKLELCEFLVNFFWRDLKFTLTDRLLNRGFTL